MLVVRVWLQIGPRVFRCVLFARLEQSIHTLSQRNLVRFRLGILEVSDFFFATFMNHLTNFPFHFPISLVCENGSTDKECACNVLFHF